MLIQQGISNTALGMMHLIKSGGDENCYWLSCIANLTTGTDNVALGQNALNQGNGSENIAIGKNSLYNQTSNQNTAVGI